MHGITQQMRYWWRGGSPSSGSDARPDGCDTKCPHTQLPMAHNIPAEGTAQKSLRRGTGPHPAAAEGEELQVHTGHAALRQHGQCPQQAVPYHSTPAEAEQRLPAVSAPGSSSSLAHANPGPATCTGEAAPGQAARHPHPSQGRPTTPGLGLGQHCSLFCSRKVGQTRSPASPGEEPHTRKMHIMFKRQTAFWKGSHSHTSRGSWH